MRSKNRRSLLGVLIVILAISHTGCGGSPGLNVRVNPSAETVQVGATAGLNANVTTVTGVPPINAAVSWTVTCPAASCGSVSPTSGTEGTVYTAPASPPESNLTVTVTAASVSEPAAQGTAAITVPSVAVTVTPNPVTVLFGEEAQVTAAVIGDPTDSGVTWVLTLCGGANLHRYCMQPPACECGTISNAESASGIPITYTAPPKGSQYPGVLVLTATSVANPLAVTGVAINISSGSNSGAVDAPPTPRAFP